MRKTMQVGLAALLVGLLGCDLLCEQAQAGPLPSISGTFEFGGSATASGPSPGTPVTISFTNPWQVIKGFGAYSGVAAGTLANFTNFDFTGDGSSAVLSAPPVAPLWSLTSGATTFSFDLQTLLNGHVEAGAISLSGSGIAHGTGFADSPAVWSISGTGTDFQFSLTSHTTAVPEGGATISLLAFGLVGIAILRRQLGWA